MQIIRQGTKRDCSGFKTCFAAFVKKQENFSDPVKKTAKRDQIRNKIAIFAAIKFQKKMTTSVKHGAAFGDMPKLTNREREKQVERFNEFYDDFDDFFNDLCDYYNGFRAFYEEHKEISEYLAKADAEEDASKDAEEDAEALQLMEAAAAKRDAEVDAAIAAAAKAKEAEAAPAPADAENTSDQLEEFTESISNLAESVGNLAESVGNLAESVREGNRSGEATITVKEV